MSSASGPMPVVPARVLPPPVTWRSWPLVEGGYPCWLMLGTLLLTGGVVGYATHQRTWALVAVLLVAIAGWRFFVPVIYELSPLGITQHILFWRRRISWRSIDRARLGRDGVFLSPPTAPLTPFRGLYLPWNGHRSEVLAVIEYYLARSLDQNSSNSRS